MIAISYPALSEYGFPLDDSWIHQVIGRNLAEFGKPGFEPGQVTSGSSSVIWPFIIAMNYKIFRWVGNVEFMILLNGALLAAIILILGLSAVRDRLTAVEIALFALLPAITGNFVWLVAIGMEHLLFIFAVLTAALAWTHRGDLSRPLLSAGVAGACCGLAILTRPEAIGLVPLFLALSRFSKRSLRDVVVFVVVSGLGGALMVASNYSTSGELLPLTVNGRRFLYFGPSPAPVYQLDLDLLWSLVKRVVEYSFGLRMSDRREAIAGGLILFGMGAGVYRLWRKKAFTLLFIVGLCAAHVAAYAIVLPTSGHGGRYQAMLIMLVFPLFAFGALQILEFILKKGFMATDDLLGYGRVGVLLCVAIIALHSLWQWSTITRAGVSHINVTHVKMARWLNENLPLGTRVAVFDIGAIGFFSHQKIIDLGGLVNADYLPYLYARRVPEYLEERNVDLVVLPMQENIGFDRVLGLVDSDRFRKGIVVEFAGPISQWMTGFSATNHAAQRQVLYRIVR